MRSKCKICGGWNDPSEWPETVRADYDPERCYTCSVNTSVDDDEHEELPVETDDDPEGVLAVDVAEKAAIEPDDCDEHPLIDDSADNGEEVRDVG